MQELRTDNERGIAGLMAIVLALYGATYGLLIGLVLYFVIEKSFFRNSAWKQAKTEHAEGLVQDS